ncbi:MAG: DUF1018 domain-containing protein [Betaproteobacteria bacterium]|nr:DUF1018 domain-containing protein [Betaproteobacteria bacterium]
MERRVNRSEGPPNGSGRNRELALIHVAKAQLGMDDETYRAMLWTIGRVQSAGDLDFPGRARVLDHLKSRGFKPTPKSSGRRSASGNSDPQTRKIVALWHALHGLGIVRDDSMQALGRWIARQTGVARPEWLNNQQAEAVIEALKAWADRSGHLINGEVA